MNIVLLTMGLALGITGVLSGVAYAITVIPMIRSDRRIEKEFQQKHESIEKVWRSSK